MAPRGMGQSVESRSRMVLENNPNIVRWVEEGLSKQLISNTLPIMKKSSR